MKTIITYGIIVSAIVGFIISCQKPNEPYKEHTSSMEGVQLFVAKAANGPINLIVFDTATTTYFETVTQTFNVGYGGVGLPSSDISIEMMLDPVILDSINEIQINDGLRPYLPLPSDAFSIDKSKATIKAGFEYSDLVTVTVFPQKLDSKKDYLLPIRLKEGTGYKLNPSASQVLYQILEYVPKPAYYKKNSWEVVYYSSQEVNGEGAGNGRAEHLIDNNPDTFWHNCWTCNTPLPHTLIVDMKQKIKIEGAGFQIRPVYGKVKNFEMLISDDNTTYTSLGNFELQDNTDLQDIGLSTAVEARYIKLIIKANHDPNSSGSAIREFSPYILK